MQKVDDYTLRQSLFGDEVEQLPGMLVSPDPMMRLVALERLTNYVADCTKPLRQLQMKLEGAAKAAEKELRESKRKAKLQLIADKEQADRLKLFEQASNKTRKGRKQNLSHLTLLVSQG